MGEKRVNDNAFTNGDGGIPILAVQISASANALSSEGRYAPIQVDSNGALKVAGSLTTTPVTNQTVNITQIGGVTVATAAGGTIAVGATNLDIRDLTQASDSVLVYGTDDGGTTKRAIKTDSGGTIQVDIESSVALTVSGNVTASANSNIATIGGNTAATGGSGILQVAANNNQIGGVTIATGGAGIQTVDIKLGGTTLATGGAGILSFNQQLLAGQTIATGGTGVQSVDVRTVGATTLATGGTGVLSFDLARVGTGVVVTASAGIQRTHTIQADDIATIYSSGAAKKPIFLQISASASGSNLLVASAASTTYVILAYNLMANGAVNAQFLSSATPMGGMIYCPTAGVGKVAPYSPVGWMQTTAAHSLNINLSANIAVGGEIVYVAI